MTEEYLTYAETISMLQEAKLDKNEQSSVSRCLAKKGGKPTKQDVAICISESRRNKKSKSKMTEKKEEDFIIKKETKVVDWVDRLETQGTGFKTLPVKKSKYVKTKDD